MEKLWRLVVSLYEKTREAKVKWEPAPRQGSYMVAFPDYGVGIRKVGEDIVIDLLASDGDVIDSASDTQLSRFSGGRSAYDLMNDLYGMARRSALGADKALDEILI